MEGPSLVILKEQLANLKGKTILSAEGKAKIDYAKIIRRKIVDIRAWGKHFLIEFSSVSIRVHFLMFGSYRINERRDREPMLTIRTKKDEVNFYSSAVTMIEDPLDSVYDWSADVLSDSWSSRRARNKLKKNPMTQIGDALLDQDIFSGVGNIIRVEVLYRTWVHPESLIADIPAKKLTEIINECRNYSFDFLRWKKDFVLKKNWLAYKKKKCKRCGSVIEKIYPGLTQRRCFICEHCQVKY